MNLTDPYSYAGLPNVSAAVSGYSRPITVSRLAKRMQDGELIEEETVVEGMGTLQPFTPQQLQIKPEGQRTWDWMGLHCVANQYSNLDFAIDDILTVFGKRYRVMSKRDFTLYGYIQYELVEGFTSD